MTLDTIRLINDIKKAFRKSRNKSSSSVRHDKTSSKPLMPIFESKSADSASACREEGNRLYSEEKFQEALVSYTKSIAFALEDSEDQCKAYRKRSAVFFKLEKYESCLLDINRALKIHCPYLVLRQNKLLDHKQRCLAEIKSSAAAVSDGVSRIDEDGTDPAPDQEPAWRAEVLSKFGNPLLPNASPKIKLEYADTKWRRHFVATADINPGEPLISEEYFMVLPTRGDKIRFRICDFCTTECHALIPCTTCSTILYCSKRCREEADDKYHRMECKLRVLPNEEGKLPFSAPSFRLFLIGTEQGAALVNLMNNLSEYDIFEENYNFAGKPFTCDYMAALRLKVKDSESISEERIKNAAVEVITELQKLAFFASVPDNQIRKAKIFATALLLNNCREWDTHSFEQDECAGLLLLQNMMNHSCYPNVEIFRRKREIIMFSIRPIKENDQLFICYKMDFENFSKVNRIREANLGFTCECEACNKNWYPLSEPFKWQEALSMVEHGLLPREEGHELLFDQLLTISTPLMDDTTLINLEVREIITIIADIVSLLHKIMKPNSYPCMKFRVFLIKFVQYFYGERERDLSRNAKLSIPSGQVERGLNERQRSIWPTDYHRKTIIRIFCVISRLNVYINHGHFVTTKNNIVG